MTSGKSPIFKLAQVGLYRDDCLAVIEGSARIVEKKIRELFKKENLGIVVGSTCSKNYRFLRC